MTNTAISLAETSWSTNLFNWCALPNEKEVDNSKVAVDMVTRKVGKSSNQDRLGQRRSSISSLISGVDLGELYSKIVLLCFYQWEHNEQFLEA